MEMQFSEPNMWMCQRQSGIICCFGKVRQEGNFGDYFTAFFLKCCFYVYEMRGIGEKGWGGRGYSGLWIWVNGTDLRLGCGRFITGQRSHDLRGTGAGATQPLTYDILQYWGEFLYLHFIYAVEFLSLHYAFQIIKNKQCIPICLRHWWPFPLKWVWKITSSSC